MRWPPLTILLTLIVLLTALLSLIGCTAEVNVPIVEKNETADTNELGNSDAWFKEQIADCDRFRPIFNEELEKRMALGTMMDLPLLYALIYQESGCKMKDEFHEIMLSRGDERETWKGGIMQVDACWRDFGVEINCSTVKQRIHYGMEVLDSVARRIAADERTYDLTIEERERLLLIAYNRGYTVVARALAYLEGKNPGVREEGGRILVTVSCPEPELCTQENEIIEVEKVNDTLEQALLIGCRQSFGFIADMQGNYCTGLGYGLNYPKEIFAIEDEIKRLFPTQEYTVQRVAKEVYIDELNFSKYYWLVKDSLGITGPGPNEFYLDKRSAFVDEEGKLHLAILQDKRGRWHSSEIVLTEGLGYGTYTWEVEGDVSHLDKEVVLGFFTYDLALFDDPNYYHRELDIELAKWGQDSVDNGQFAIQGLKNLSLLRRINMSSNGTITASFTWLPQKVIFRMIGEQGVISSWESEGTHVPAPGNERVRINLWLHKGNAPQEETEVVVKRFTFIPST